MFEFIEEKVNPAFYNVRIIYVTDKHRGSGIVKEFSDLNVGEKDIEHFLSLINKLKESLSSGKEIVPSDYFGDYILENEDYSCTIDVPVIHCSFSSYFYKIESIEAYYHEKHTVKKVKMK